MLRDSMMNNVSMLFYMQMTPFLLGCLTPLLKIIGSLLGIKKYRLTGNLANKFERLICFSTGLNESSRPEGIIMGKWFVGKIEVMRDGRCAWYYGTDSVLKKLKDTSDKEEPMDTIDDKKISQNKAKTNKPIAVYSREGTYGWFEYTEINFYPPSIIPTSRQQESIDKILASYMSPDIGGQKIKEYCTALISGPPGTGKSSIPILLAKHLMENGKEVSLIDTFNPTDPGDSFDKLYNRIEPTKDKPLIVVLEEVDVIIRQLKEKIPKHKNSPILISDKSGWNSFFDNFGKNRYRYVYFVMTSNMMLDWFNSEDPSYFRKGRVDECIEF